MSTGLLFLTANDFYIKQTGDRLELCNKLQGLSFVLFYSTKCRYCHTLSPEFKTLPSIVQGFQFGMINVTTFPAIADMSRGTNTEIQYVPLIILYNKGAPLMRYEGPPIKSEMAKFVVSVAKKINQNMKFTQNVVKKGKELPAYCIANPLYGKSNVCYLEFDKAYNNK